MENIYVKKVSNGYVVEVSPYGDDELTYIYTTKEEMIAAFPAHVEEAVKLSEEAKKKKEEKEAAKAA
jgi:hypothetical protein